MNHKYIISLPPAERKKIQSLATSKTVSKTVKNRAIPPSPKLFIFSSIYCAIFPISCYIALLCKVRKS